MEVRCPLCVLACAVCHEKKLPYGYIGIGKFNARW